jgi:3-deoxy-D-manno-octulosonic acid kinase
VIAAPLEDAVRALGLLEPGGLERLLRDGAAGAGRSRNAVVPLPGCEERLHLRPFRHGGWLANLLGDRLPGLGRPLAELAANARLATAGAPVPRPVLVAGRRRAPGVWTAAVGTLHAADAIDAGEFLSKCPERERLLAVAEAAGTALRRFHDAGGRHADLHVGNLLIQDEGSSPRMLLVDLDRARIEPRVSARRRMAEIMRLYRSLVKRRFHAALAPETAVHFLDAYTAGDTDLRNALLAQLPRERLRLAIHRLGYGRGSRTRVSGGAGRSSRGDRRGPPPPARPGARERRRARSRTAGS